MSETPSSFADLLAPLTPHEFFDRYWERDPLHLEAARSDRWQRLFSLADVDRWIASTRSSDAEGILVMPPGGTESGSRRFPAGTLPLADAYAYLAQGCSFVLNALERSWYPLMPLVESIAASFSADVGVNAYLTPAGSKAFPVHVDDHDVLVLQISGEKHWRLHPLGERPVKNLTYRKDLDVPTAWKAQRDLPVLAEIRLGPGDLLYVPRGMPHSASARDSCSLHLTCSVIPLYWVDFLKAAVEQACLEEPLLRRALPPSFAIEPAAAEAMESGFGAALAAFGARVSFAETFRALRRRSLRLYGFPPGGQLAHVLWAAELDDGSALERRAEVLCAVEPAERDGSCTLRFGSGFVRGPGRLRSAFEFVRDHERFRVADLPGLDAEARLVLARRLMREGLLRRAPGD